MPLQAGRTILNGKYRLLRLIGEGGMARVWLAEEPGFAGRLVAIKEPKAGLSPDDQTDLARRWQQEVALCAALERARVTGTVRTFTLEPQPDGSQLLVMEYMEGGSLAGLLAAHPGGLPVERAVGIARDVLGALEGLHRLPSAPVHRDVKPENILLDGEGRAHLGDYGLAQLPGLSGRSRMVAGPHPGTPLYMAPEQARSAEPLTPAADLFGLGCALFEMLTGQRYKRVRPGTAAASLRAEVPEWLDGVVAKALAEDPWERWKSAGEMARALEAGEGEPRTVRKDAEGVGPREPRKGADGAEGVGPREPRKGAEGVGPREPRKGAEDTGPREPRNGADGAKGVGPWEPRKGAEGMEGEVSRTGAPPWRRILLAAAAVALVLGFAWVVMDSLRPSTPAHTPAGVPPTPTAKLPPSAAPKPTPDPMVDGKIVFARSQYYEKGAIAVMNADGSHQVDLTGSDVEAGTPSWSPDGRTIAWVRTGNVWLMDADGDNPRAITTWNASSLCARGPVFSPDGRRIAVVNYCDEHPGNSAIVIMDADGTNQHWLVEGLWPSWSPDGARIVYTPQGADANGCGLSVVEVETSRVTELGRGAADCHTFAAWSPDGTKIAFAAVTSSQEVLCTIRPDGTGERQLVKADSDYISGIGWSPDGSTIVYSDMTDIYVIGAGGGARTKLASGGMAPAWQPAVP